MTKKEVIIAPEFISKRHHNFGNMDLSNATFKKVDLSYANFKGANLAGAKFHECVLYHTNFKGANMSETTEIRHIGMRSPLEAKAHFDGKQKEILGLEKERNRT